MTRRLCFDPSLAPRPARARVVDQRSTGCITEVISVEFVLILGLFVTPPAQYNTASRPQLSPAVTSAEFKTKEACEKAAAATAVKWKEMTDANGLHFVYTCNPK